MRLALDRHRLLGRARDVSGWTIVEAALIVLVAIQCARLVWAAVTPVGPIGDWKPGATRAADGPSALSGFDPFFRLSADAGPATVTALNLTLHGIRQDQATGRGSAIIATPDGRQRSFAVGDEVAPGVRLTGVAFDHVTIARGGSTEQLFMRQPDSAPAPTAPTAPAGIPTATPEIVAPASTPGGGRR